MRGAPEKRKMPRVWWWSRNVRTSGDTASHTYHRQKPYNENLNVHIIKGPNSDSLYFILFRYLKATPMIPGNTTILTAHRKNWRFWIIVRYLPFLVFLLCLLSGSPFRAHPLATRNVCMVYWDLNNMGTFTLPNRTSSTAWRCSKIRTWID